MYYKDHIGKSSSKHDIDPYLVTAIIDVESGFNKEAVSAKDARGLMQITEQTGKWGFEQLKMDDYDNEKLFIPEVNIEIGTWYLQRLKQEFNGDMDLVLAAYNGGSGNVTKWLKDKEYSSDGKTLDKIPFKETENYVKKVNTRYEKYKKMYGDINFEKEEWDSIFVNYIYRILDLVKRV
nr:lytic transglycosylase domain-containing protein [Tissierella sp.]